MGRVVTEIFINKQSFEVLHNHYPFCGPLAPSVGRQVIREEVEINGGSSYAYGEENLLASVLITVPRRVSWTFPRSWQLLAIT